MSRVPGTQLQGQEASRPFCRGPWAVSGRRGHLCPSQQRLDKVAWELKACARVRVRVEERGLLGERELAGGGSRAMAKVALVLLSLC